MNREMQAPSATQADPYSHVITTIQHNGPARISVPELSKLLGVKATTLNARFRRQQTGVSTVGRTNFVPVELALRLAELHKYALIGWPTLQQASRLTGVKSGTIKARCEKGRLEGYVDLTKRLRVNPAALENLQWNLSTGRIHRPSALDGPVQLGNDRAEQRAAWTTNLPGRNHTRHEPPAGPRGQRADVPASERRMKIHALTAGGPAWTAPKHRPFVLPPAPQPQIDVLTGRDYGLAELEEGPDATANGAHAAKGKAKNSIYLSYDPEAPFSISDCAVGQAIRYGPYGGRIVQLIDDPFSPKILVKFPQHTHPLMRQVLLIVGKSHLAATA